VKRIAILGSTGSIGRSALSVVDAHADRLRLLRHAAAPREMPMTLERAPWAVREQVGYFGAYREGVGQLVGALKDAFDPAGVFVVPMSN